MWPSGVTCDTRSESLMPPPPGILSTITCLPITSVRYCARMRPSMSTGPPAAKGTTMVTGRAGQSWACAPAAAANAATASAVIGAHLRLISCSANSLIDCPVSYHIAGSDRPGEFPRVVLNGWWHDAQGPVRALDDGGGQRVGARFHARDQAGARYHLRHGRCLAGETRGRRNRRM